MIRSFILMCSGLAALFLFSALPFGCGSGNNNPSSPSAPTTIYYVPQTATATLTFPPGTLTATSTPTFSNTPTKTSTPTTTFPPTLTNSPLPTSTPVTIYYVPATGTFTPTFTQGTLTSTATPTQTSTPTSTPTATATRQPRLTLSWIGYPSSQSLPYNQTNASSLQFILTAHGQEPVSVSQIGFGLQGTIGSTGFVTGSGDLFPDNASTDVNGNGILTGGGDVAYGGTYGTNGVTFTGSNLYLIVSPGAPQTLILAMSLNAPAGGTFTNTISTASIVAAGVTTGLPAILSGDPINGNPQTVLALTPTNTPTLTPTNSPTVTFTPQPRLILSWIGNTPSQNLPYNQSPASTLQIILSAHGQEPVSVSQIAFGLEGTVGSAGIAAGSVGLYPDLPVVDPGNNGILNPAGVGAFIKSGTFGANGVTFTGITGLIVTPGSPLTVILAMNLNAPAGGTLTNTISTSSIVAVGANTGTPALLLGDPINGNPQTIQAAPIGNITTVAGNGTQEPNIVGLGTGDGGPATVGELYSPKSICFDTSGDLYVADHFQTRMVNTSGVISSFINSNNPVGIAMDPLNNFYFANTASQVLEFTYGNQTVIAGMFGGGPFNGDNIPATSAQLLQPDGVAVDNEGNIYIADTGNNRVQKVTTNGIITTVAGGGSVLGDGGPATQGQLNQPSAVVVDSVGDLFIADTGNNRIREVSLGLITTIAGNGTANFGGDNGSAPSAELNAPGGVAVDASGNIYIADTGNNRVRKVTVGGTITTVAGNGTPGYSGDNALATSAELNHPGGVALSPSGMLYIADTANYRVRMVN